MLRRPYRSMMKKHQTRASTVLMTPNTPVVRSDVEVPVTPIDLKMVGELREEEKGQVPAASRDAPRGVEGGTH